MPSLLNSFNNIGETTENIANQFLGFNAADVLRFTDLQREYQWDIKFPELGQLAVFGVSLIDLGKYAQAVSFGNYLMAKAETVNVGAFVNNFASRLSLPELKVTFLRPIPDIVTPYFNKWRQYIVDDQGIYYPKSNYAKNIYIYMLGTDNLISGTFKLVNVFPMNLPSYNLSYSGEGMLKFDVTFSVDRVEMF